MWLVLTETRDPVLPWLTEGLGKRTRGPVHSLTSDELCQVSQVETEHASGEVHFTIHLGTGFVIDSRTLHGVVNLVTALPPGLAQRCESADRTQIARNYTSPVWRLFSEAACPFLNRPSPQGLVGDYRLASDWVLLAKDLGLGAPEYDPLFGDKCPSPTKRRQSMIVIEGEVVPVASGSGRLPAQIASKCRVLADAARSSILGLDLCCDAQGSWCFLGADPRPDLRQGGNAVLDAIASILGATGASGRTNISATEDDVASSTSSTEPTPPRRQVNRWRSLFS